MLVPELMVKRRSASSLAIGGKSSWRLQASLLTGEHFPDPIYRHLDLHLPNDSQIAHTKIVSKLPLHGMRLAFR